MKVEHINFENKTVECDKGVIFPVMFVVDENMTLDEFQELVNKSDNAIKELLS